MWTEDSPSTLVHDSTATATLQGDEPYASPSVVSSAVPSSIYYSFDYQSLTTGAVIGIAIGSAVGGLVVGSLLIWLLVRKVLGRRERQEEASKKKASGGAREDDVTGGAGASAKEDPAQHVKPVYELDDSAMRREMDDTGPAGEMEGEHKQPAAVDRYRRYLGFKS